MSNIKHVHWFPHPADLRNDRRMKRAMKDLPGGVGYGSIVLIMEVLRCEPGFKYPMKDLDLLASEFNISLPILQTVIASYGFFELIENESGQIFVSPMLNELMVPFVEKQKQNQIAGKISAAKRRKKQEEQLKLLSQLSSSQHVYNKCATDAEQNRIENKREEKNRSLFADFQSFKAFVLESYKGVVVCYGAKGFTETTAISVSKQGYLHNEVSRKDLSKEDALKVWQWMFENQDRLCEARDES